MADGDILRGKTGFPLFGRNGTILYQTPISMTCSIVISWEGGRDVDICAFYTHAASAKMGYSYSNSINVGDGFTASWGGDNTSGGPETVSLAYEGASGIKAKTFEIHANWFSVGTDSEGHELSGGGPATVTATDARGTVKSFTLMPATSKGKAATAGDPGCMIRFNNDGTINSIVAA